jgi:Mrp family chromosome partitioning ATPase
LENVFEPPTASTSARAIRVTRGSNRRYAKSQIATQLARLLSERKSARVLLMEADLDAPALSKLLRVNVPRGFGFSEQLERSSEARNGESSLTLLRITASLHALVEGRTGTPALFDSGQFVAALQQQRAERDVIVIDGPVVDTWPDSRSLESSADCVVFVVAAGAALAEAKSLSRRHATKNRCSGSCKRATGQTLERRTAIRLVQFASIFRRVAREKRRQSGTYVEAFRGRAGGRAA